MLIYCSTLYICVLALKLQVDPRQDLEETEELITKEQRERGTRGLQIYR